MDTIKKQRTPSRCREWERQRRNKFNEAITRLGELVRKINKSNDASEDSETVQYPKIEIIQKAIICLTNYSIEKTSLKAEILALQVKLEASINNKQDKKDVSTQVFIKINKKLKKKNYVKLLMLNDTENSKCSKKTQDLKEPITTLVTKSINVSTSVNNNQCSQQKLPTILPRTNSTNIKKGTENTIVVLPATPYIFPQRPLLFPTVPPAFVLVDPNSQLNKQITPVINRYDVTKTTMVNILPISAYSRPLSATKLKKKIIKNKSDTAKKPSKNCKISAKPKLDTAAHNDSNTKSIEDKAAKENNKDSKIVISNNEKESDGDKISLSQVHGTTKNSDNEINNVEKCSEKLNCTNSNESTDITEKEITTTSIPKIGTISNDNLKVGTCLVDHLPKPNITVHKDSNTKTDTEKLTTDKEITSDKEKQNKLPNILDSALCDHVVDAGNARLELAEELLAASPTAVFLMSFPLVSGNRADSPAEDPQNAIVSKDNSHRRNDIGSEHQNSYFEKHNSVLKQKDLKIQPSLININKQNDNEKYINKKTDFKAADLTPLAITSSENPFLNLPPCRTSTTCTVADSTFGLEYECSANKAYPNQTTSYSSSGNLFYKNDPFNTVKNTIYSTSNISSGHDFNTLGLYPCAVEKYTNKNKSEYPNTEENIMKIGSSRLTYDIDLGWSHKGFDFVNCSTSANTLNKDSNLLTTTPASYSTSYNPFTPDFHVALTTNSNKKESSSKASSSFVDTLTNFYSQTATLWSEDLPFYSNSNFTKSFPLKEQNYHSVNQPQNNLNIKNCSLKQAETKHVTDLSDRAKQSSAAMAQQSAEKYTKKSPNKMHINWMTSEVRPVVNNCESASSTENKGVHKTSFSNHDLVSKKQDHTDSNYFPITMHNFPTQTTQDDLQLWPSARPLGTTEISIEPPPINLPTLVGDLALGPHDKKKHTDKLIHPTATDVQNAGNFLSVTQLMNRSTEDPMATRYHVLNTDTSKINSQKQNTAYNESSRKNTRLDNNISQPCYVFNEFKPTTYDATHFSHNKSKVNKTEKNTSKVQKNNYSAESLIKSGTCTQKMQENNSKFLMPPQKYHDFTSQESSAAQVSHFPPILDYSDNSYSSQQYAGTTLYNSTTNTISNSFYSNLMPGTSNLMASNYTGGHFSGDFIDYNQTTECNYSNQKYEEMKMRHNPTLFPQDKTNNYKSTRREASSKHKIECSKKETNKKYQNKRPKLNTETEEWSETAYLPWQNKSSKRHSMPEETPYPNYMGNQMPTQYQSDYFNSHIIPSNVQGMTHNMDRSLTSFPVTSRANFNLSAIFPEITMKVQ